MRTALVPATPPPVAPIGARSDALASGRSDSEIFLRIDATIPMRRLGKDLLAFDKGTYPVLVNDQLDRGVERERFITYEKKRHPWNLIH